MAGEDVDEKFSSFFLCMLTLYGTSKKKGKLALQMCNKNEIASTQNQLKKSLITLRKYFTFACAFYWRSRRIPRKGKKSDQIVCDEQKRFWCFDRVNVVQSFDRSLGLARENKIFISSRFFYETGPNKRLNIRKEIYEKLHVVDGKSTKAWIWTSENLCSALIWSRRVVAY